jgi:glycosyltransferase involved in cell wall biosynthesis
VERFVIGAVARLSPEKGFDLLVRAIERLVGGGADVGLVIVGEGEEGPRLHALVQELNLGERVRLLGYRSDVLEIYQALDAYALSSIREGLPNVLLEAMAVAVPVAATRIAGVPNLIRDGENGLLIPPGDLDALTAALSRLHGDPPLRDRLGAAARRTIEEQYSFRDRMRKIADLYDRLLKA